MQISDRNIERLLSKTDWVSPEQWAEAKVALERQTQKKTSLQDYLVNLGFVKEDALLQLAARDLGVPYVDLETLSPEPAIVLLVPEEIGMERGVMALDKQGNLLTCAMEDPNDSITVDLLGRRTGLAIVPQLASRGAILKKLSEYHDHYKISVVEELLRKVRDQGKELSQQFGLNIQSLESVSNEQAPIVKAVNVIIIGALLKRASDIHLVPDKTHIRVKYRVDGVLQDEQSLAISDAPAVVSRIKIMSRLDISEKRMPQDGAFHIMIEGREIDFRVATTPTVYGEKVVMRVLDKSGLVMGLDHLGFSDHPLRQLNRQIHKPHGIILIVGPTGSGKTTTLYAALNILNTGDKNITTVEDPVEYKIEGLTQIQVNADIGLDFSAALRSILRQDPDVVLLGEIRDLETTEIAIRAALTGHLVFATLHTNDAASAVARLVEMGAEPYLVASALRCVVSQRLVRNICSHCRQEIPVPAALLERFVGPWAPKELPTHLWHGKGCNYCFNTGYRGRIVISEMLLVNEAMRPKIVARAGSDEIQEMAEANGMRPMYWDGMGKILRGITTLEEVLEVSEEADA
ncbi:MAG TPA: ATPase, T2SS/T4P/T4SS family [bacterium]|nr:ATPase, T2SS/T4P/T4SS family [bacterium]